MRKFFGPMGSVSRVTVESQALKNNMLGDPSMRVVDVYLPTGHDGEGLPLLVDLVGFTGSGLSHTNWAGFRENLPERLDRLIGEQRMPPVVVAFPDCFTRLGGNQYINSASMGAWEDFLLHEMLPAIEQRFGYGGSGRRGVFGKSSAVWHDHTCASPLRHLVGRGVPTIWVLSSAICPICQQSWGSRRLGELHRALVAAARSRRKLLKHRHNRGSLAFRPVDCRSTDILRDDHADQPPSHGHVGGGCHG